MVSAQIEKRSRNSGIQYSVQYTNIKKNNKYQKKTFFSCHLWLKEDFIHGKSAHTAIEEKSIDAGSSLLVPSISLPVQVRAATFGTSLFSPTVNLVEGAGAHTACNANLSLLLELHGLQAKTATATQCWHWHWSFQPAEERRKQCGRLRPQQSTLSSPLPTGLFHVKSHYQIYALLWFKFSQRPYPHKHLRRSQTLCKTSYISTQRTKLQRTSLPPCVPPIHQAPLTLTS